MEAQVNKTTNKKRNFLVHLFMDNSISIKHGDQKQLAVIRDHYYCLFEITWNIKAEIDLLISQVVYDTDYVTKLTKEYARLKAEMIHIDKIRTLYVTEAKTLL